MRLFPLLFIVIPILEMWLLIEVGGEIGALNTVGLVFLTAAIGYALLRHQGVATLRRAQQRMAQGEMPAKEMVEGICLAVGGALLLTPGFLTDAFGFMCLLPGLRSILLAGVIRKVAVNGQFQQGFQSQNHSQDHSHSRGQTFEHEGDSQSYRDTHSHSSRTEAIEGQFKREDD